MIDEIAKQTKNYKKKFIRNHDVEKKLLLNIETWLHAYVNLVYTCDEWMNVCFKSGIEVFTKTKLLSVQRTRVKWMKFDILSGFVGCQFQISRSHSATLSSLTALLIENWIFVCLLHTSFLSISVSVLKVRESTGGKIGSRSMIGVRLLKNIRRRSSGWMSRRCEIRRVIVSSSSPFCCFYFFLRHKPD